jgi:hypothetical protein
MYTLARKSQRGRKGGREKGRERERDGGREGQRDACMSTNSGSPIGYCRVKEFERV